MMEVSGVCVRPVPGPRIPELTARVARASNPKRTAAMCVRDRLDGLWSDEDFEQWYPRDGRPGLSPAQLATVSPRSSSSGPGDAPSDNATDGPSPGPRVTQF
jgi:hypothetical protein